jgi:hypothetical protein
VCANPVPYAEKARSVNVIPHGTKAAKVILPFVNGPTKFQKISLVAHLSKSYVVIYALVTGFKDIHLDYVLQPSRAQSVVVLSDIVNHHSLRRPSSAYEAVIASDGFARRFLGSTEAVTRTPCKKQWQKQNQRKCKIFYNFHGCETRRAVIKKHANLQLSFIVEPDG